ncbi:MAG: hypothetical protein HOW73_14595 [Polyangiaceae bacterium]|nr:hypothetical protein [Polyangiaceae bacterium]
MQRAPRRATTTSRGPAVFAIALASFAGVTCAPPPELDLPPALPGAPPMPGPAPRERSFHAVDVNTRCEHCHTEIAAEWRASFHRMAHSDPTYLAQFEKEPLAFCTGCHAPEADPATAAPPDAADMGVGCVTCHIVGDQILAAPASNETTPPHPLTRTNAFASPAACAGCHEFSFPASVHDKTPLLMQSTMSEHTSSAHAEASCASCHMPVVTGRDGRAHKSHGFASSRDPAGLREAVVVERHIADDGALEITLRPGRVGHAFPTGDLLRRLRLSFEVRDAQKTIVERRERIFQRRFGFTNKPFKPPRRILAGDDRVGLGGASVEARFLPRVRPAGGAIHYTLHYDRVADPTGGEDGQPLVEGSVLLAEGEVEL